MAAVGRDLFAQKMTRYKSDETSGKFIVPRRIFLLFLCIAACESFTSPPNHVVMSKYLGRAATNVGAALVSTQTRGYVRRSTNVFSIPKAARSHSPFRNVSSQSEGTPLIVFPGGGIYFWWQVKI